MLANDRRIVSENACGEEQLHGEEEQAVVAS
jgi:hypothetical protein